MAVNLEVNDETEIDEIMEEVYDQKAIVYRSNVWEIERGETQYLHKNQELHCNEYDLRDQELFIHGYCREMEKKLNMIIPDLVRSTILIQYSLLQDIWIEM